MQKYYKEAYNGATTAHIEAQLYYWDNQNRDCDECDECDECDDDCDPAWRAPKIVYSLRVLWKHYNENLYTIHKSREDTPMMTFKQYCYLFPKQYCKCSSYRDAQGYEHSRPDSVLM